MPVHIDVDLSGHLFAVILLIILLHRAGRHCLWIPRGILHIMETQSTTIFCVLPSSHTYKTPSVFSKKRLWWTSNFCLWRRTGCKASLIFCWFCCMLWFIDAFATQWCMSVALFFPLSNIYSTSTLYMREITSLFYIPCLIGTYMTFPDVINI